MASSLVTEVLSDVCKGRVEFFLPHRGYAATVRAKRSNLVSPNETDCITYL